jgi:photosystem II stability/assembly factor-like uncharacterized protein
MRRLSQRQWRAAGLSALALVGIAAAGFAYLHRASTTQSPSAVQPTAGKSPTPLGNIFRYDLVSPSMGWAIAGTVSPTGQAGPIRLFRTVDGAKHWQRQLSVQSEAIAESLDSFNMIDAANGFVVAEEPLRLYRTHDAGTRWTAVDLPSQDVIQVTFSDIQNGWALAASRTASPSYSGPQLYATTDAGTSWTRLPDPPADAAVIEFQRQSQGWIGAQGAGQPHVYSSADGGHSWAKHVLPTPPGFLADNLYGTYPQLLPDVGVVAVMNDREADYTLTSFDRGATWTYTAPPSGVVSQMYPSFAYVDAFHWWAVEGTALYKSSDAGLSWKHISDSVPDGMNFLRVFDSRAAVAWAQFSQMSGSGLVLTIDGGLHWTSLKVPTTDTV